MSPMSLRFKKTKIKIFHNGHFLIPVNARFFVIRLGNPLYLWYFTTTPRAVSRSKLGITT